MEGGEAEGLRLLEYGWIPTMLYALFLALSCSPFIVRERESEESYLIYQLKQIETVPAKDFFLGCLNASHCEYGCTSIIAILLTRYNG